MYLKIVLLVLCVSLGQTMGLRCYSCGFSSVDTDQSCLTIDDDTSSVECPYTYCTIMRQEFLDPPGEVASFMRGCTDTPVFMNHEVTDFNFRTFYRACTSELCNIGNGIQQIAGGGLQPRPEYNGENLLVPGTGNTGNSAGNVQITSLSVLLAMLLTYIM